MASPEKKARYNVSGQTKDAIEQNDWAEVARILSKCSRRDSDSVMTQLVSRDQWDAVKQVIRCVGDEERTWSIEGILVKNNILLSVAEGNWRGIDEMPHERFLHSTLEWILQQACTRAQQIDIVQYVLPHCEDDQLDSALQQLVTHGLWFAAGRILQRGVGDELVKFVIQKACSEAGELTVRVYIIPFCPTVTLDCLLTDLVSHDMWHAVGRVLMRGVSDTQHCWALQKACSRIEGWRIKLLLLPHCKKDHCSTVLTNLVSDGQWGSVEKLLHCVNSASVVVKADGMFIDNDCLQMIVRKNWIAILGFLANNKRDIEEVHRFCEDSLRDAKTVFHIYERHNDMLQPVEFDTGFIWVDGKQGFPSVTRYLKSVFAVIRDIVIKGHYKETVVCIIPRCAGYQLDYVFTQCFDMFLKSSCRLSHELVCSSTDFPDTWTIHILDVNAANDRTAIIASSKCAEDQLDSVLKQMLTRPAWWALGKVLEQGLDDKSVTTILKQTLLYDDDQMIVEHVLPHCTDSQTDLAVTELVSAGQWKSVTKLVQLVGDRKQTWTVGGTSVDTTLLHLVAGGRWREIGDTLQRGVDDQHHNWLVQIASITTSSQLLAYILPHCADDQLDSVLTTLVERRLWEPVGVVLKRGVSDSVKRWAVAEAFTKYDEDDDYEYDDDHYAGQFLIDIILPQCADDQLDSVLTTLVERRLWLAVVEVLNRGVSGSVKRWAVDEACQHCDDAAGCRDVDEYIIEDILPHCADDQLDSVLTTLVKRRLWWAVGETLQRGVSDSVKRWAVMEACQHCDDDVDCGDVNEYMVEGILPHCADDQLDSVLTILVERRLWLIAQRVLQRVAGDLNKAVAGQKTCQHCRSAGVHLSKCRIRDSDCLVTKPLTPHCSDDNFDSPTSALTKTNACTAVRNMSGREVSDAQRRENIRAAFRHADEDTLIENILPHYVYDSIHCALNILASRRFWSAFLVLLHKCIIDTLYIWAAAKETEPKDEVFWDIVRNPCSGVKGLTPAMWRSVTWSGLRRSLKQLLDWDTPLCEVLCESLLAIGKEVWLSGREKEMYGPEHTVTKEASSTVEHLHELLMECKTHHVSDLLSCTEGMRHKHSKNKSGTCFRFQLYFIKHLVHQYYKRKAWKQMTDAILIVLTTVPVVPDVQSVALRVMLRHNRWDVISHACLSGVCEQDRRQLFQAAVKQRQWSAVKRWADHTLYDDQRLWAMGEARQEKRWDVYLKLSDHGLYEWERVGVLFRVTMHAELTLLHHMLTTVADVTDMIDLLTNTPGVVSKLGVKNNERRMNDLKVFENNLMKDTHTLKTLTTRVKRGKWWVVLHNIRHKPNLQHARRALKAAVSSEAWHAVMQLVRLETDVTRRDSLFRDMVRLRQWSVCRELLEQGVSHELSLELLSEFIGHCQWSLVAMVMDCTMDDDRRKRIMHQAIMRREGSVVWECINKLHTCLSVDEREEMFQLAFSREVWQAVKPLIEETDVTGIRHRDTALLEAIEQHQWDVVDHCQRHHADINMKDDDGHTPIHRAARKGDWEAVKELTVRDGDPNLLDSEGLSVLHRAIRAKQWDAVKLLIQFHGDIHQAPLCKETNIYPIFDYDERKTRTPLQMLIDARQGEVIETSLMWCPDQQKVVNREKETVLHAVCLSGWPGALHHLIARKGDPLAVTERGLTALCYAVLCKDCPQRMVAECIKMGFSTHQAHITYTARIDMTCRSGLLTEKDERLLISPLALAVMRGLPVVTQMLCEAGACSRGQLRELNVHLVELTKPNTDTGRTFRSAFCVAWRDIHNLGYRDPDYSLIEQSADYLHQVSSTPRSLVSTCRLVISRCLTLSKTRHRDLAQLPLSPMMKNYLMFSDLTDPRYPDLSYRGKE